MGTMTMILASAWLTIPRKNTRGLTKCSSTREARAAVVPRGSSYLSLALPTSGNR